MAAKQTGLSSFPAWCPEVELERVSGQSVSFDKKSQRTAALAAVGRNFDTPAALVAAGADVSQQGSGASPITSTPRTPDFGGWGGKRRLLTGLVFEADVPSIAVNTHGLRRTAQSSFGLE